MRVAIQTTSQVMSEYTKGTQCIKEKLQNARAQQT